MVVISGKVFGIEPIESVVNRFMREFDPDYVELYSFGILKEYHKTTAGIFGFSLECAEEMYKGTAVWVCPD